MRRRRRDVSCSGVYDVCGVIYDFTVPHSGIRHHTQGKTKLLIRLIFGWAEGSSRLGARGRGGKGGIRLDGVMITHRITPNMAGSLSAWSCDGWKMFT